MFFREKKKYFSLKNTKYKYYISCQFVETDASKANLHTENEVKFIVDKKKNAEKAISKFSLLDFEISTHLKGLMTFGDN